MLDNRYVMSRKKRPLLFPTEELALLIASDWEAQDKIIKAGTMQFMNMVCEAIDHNMLYRQYIIKELIGALEYDTCCFLANEDKVGYSKKLIEKQKNIYFSLIDWFYETTGLKVNHTDGMFVSHPKYTIDCLEFIYKSMAIWTLTAFHFLHQSTRSIILPFALWYRHITIEEAIAAFSLEEEHHDSINVPPGNVEIINKESTKWDILGSCLYLYSLNINPPEKIQYNIDIEEERKKEAIEIKSKLDKLNLERIEYKKKLEEHKKDPKIPKPTEPDVSEYEMDPVITEEEREKFKKKNSF